MNKLTKINWPHCQPLIDRLFANHLFLICFLIFSCSCTKYQYVWLQSDLPDHTEDGYIHENDTLRISYKFRGLDCPVVVDIFNKLEKPVFVDLNQSAIIIDGDILPLWNGNNHISVSFSGSGIEWSEDISVYMGDIQGIISQNEAVRFLAPSSHITISGLHLTNKFLQVDNYVESTKVKLTTPTGTSNGTKYNFNMENTPMRFRSFITYSVHKNLVEPQYTDDKFWVTETIETMVSPNSMVFSPANRYHVKQQTEFGKVTGGLIVTIAALIWVAN